MFTEGDNGVRVSALEHVGGDVDANETLAARIALQKQGFVQWRSFLDRTTCLALVSRIEAARALWNHDFGGSQYSLGRAYYPHLEEGNTPAYFANSEASNALVQDQVPGLIEALILGASAVLDGRAQQRAQWCGPAIVVFPAGGWVATNGGAIHSDMEGLSLAARRERVPAYTAILMLQPAARGGELRVWDERLMADTDLDHLIAGLPSVDIKYGAGDLVMIDSYRVHQIRPFSGDLDRIAMTAHFAKKGPDWEVWF